MTLSNKAYDILKFMCTIFLPACASLYFGMSELWADVFVLPYPTEVVGTIALICTFIGTILKISSDNYMGDGQLIVDSSDPLVDVYNIAIPDYPETLAEKDTVVLKVSNPRHMSE